MKRYRPAAGDVEAVRWFPGVAVPGLTEEPCGPYPGPDHAGCSVRGRLGPPACGPNALVVYAYAGDWLVRRPCEPYFAVVSDGVFRASYAEV